MLAAFFIINMTLAQKKSKHASFPIPDSTSIAIIVTNLSEELSLSEKQEEQISKLYFEHYEQVKSISERNKYFKYKGHKEFKQLNANFEKEIKSLLTKKQKRKYENYLQKMKLYTEGKLTPEAQ